jgi:hypothetical protein
VEMSSTTTIATRNTLQAAATPLAAAVEVVAAVETRSASREAALCSAVYSVEAAGVPAVLPAVEGAEGNPAASGRGNKRWCVSV